jgi:diguanylate cyclase (GGDEF)-like protein
VVELIVNTVRTTDTVYRFGGEEFVVLMPEPRGSRALAERVRQVVSRAGMEHADNDAWGVVTISAGIVTVRAGDAGDSDSWLVRADRALYAAKLGGRNRIAVARKLGPPVAVGAPPRQVSPA